jgi:hypothetical protein
MYQRISRGPGHQFRNMTRFYGEELLAPRPTPKLEDHTFSAYATAYSIYSQVPSTLEALFHQQPQDALCSGHRDPFI